MSSGCPENVISYHGRQQVRGPGLALHLSRLFQWADAVVERYRQRRALMSLDDRILRDIGLSRADVDREVTKPVWRL